MQAKKNKGHNRKIKPFRALKADQLKMIHAEGKTARRVVRAMVSKAKNKVDVKLEELRTKRLHEAREAKAKKLAAKQNSGITFIGAKL